MNTTTSHFVTQLLPSLAGLDLEHIEIGPTAVTIHLTATAPVGSCPLCATPSQQIHSAYTRTLADLPWADSHVRLLLGVRKFFCKVPSCARRIFTERLPHLVAPYARRTLRLAQVLTLIGFALGGQAGARLVARLGMAVSPTTLLRLIRRAPEPTPPVPRILGVDDFALRKGRTYGTVLVDLEEHRPVDLLPDRTAATLATWLREHPGVEVISRDRSTEYTRGATLGAPQAQQVADRFHLVKNLREAVERLLDRNRSRLRGIVLPRTPAQRDNLAALPPTAQRRPARRSPAETSARQLRQMERRTCYEQVRVLHAGGQNIVQIAQQLELSRGTVYRYLRSDADPTVPPGRAVPSRLDPYLPYLYKRWQDGCENAAQLLRELREQGYPGSRKMVATWVAQRRRVPAKTGPRPERSGAATSEKQHAGSERPQELPPKPERTASSTQFSYFLLREPDSLDSTERAILKRLQEVSPDIQTGYGLIQEFVGMVRGRHSEQLENWLTKAKRSNLRDLRSFAAGIEKDKEAVAAGLREEWSNGQVEGQVNRLKLKKREMYGRANFDLLRRRVLAAA